MSDRILLEQAAKAANIKLADEVDSYIPGSRAMWVVGPGGRDAIWNPLNDDGDALRLAVELNMNVEVTGGKWIYACAIYGNCSELVSGDKFAATRRAIVRAAAEIGVTK